MPKVPLDGKGRVKDLPPMSQEVPDPELLRKDPMAEIFGPGTGVKLIGDQEDEIPDEVRAVLEEFGLSKKAFQCVLKEIPEGSNIGEYGSSTNTEYIKGWVRGVPSVDYIAKNYGPGLYMLQFSWRTKEEDPETGKPTSKAYHQEVTIPISQKAAGEYKKHRLDKKLREASEIGTQVQEAMLEKKLETAALKGVIGDPDEKSINPAMAAKQYIQETMEAAKMIGLSPIASMPQPKSLEWDKILPALMTGVTAFLQMQQQAEASRRDEFNKLLMLMVSNSQQSSGHLIELVKAQVGNNTGKNAAQEFKDMLFSVVDIKEALSGNRETLADKIFHVIEGVAPMILSVAATAAEAKAAQNSPTVKMAKRYIDTNPDFQALKKNPEEMKKAVGKMDDFFGWRQTDTILAIAGWERPGECVRDPAKEHAPLLPEDEGSAVPPGGRDITPEVSDISEGEVE